MTRSRPLIVAVLVLGAICALGQGLGEGSQPKSCNRRVLRVALYPFVPGRADLFGYVEHAFEARHCDVDVQIVDLSENYYNQSKPKAVTNTDADIWELDSVFLDDFVANGQIQALPDQLLTSLGPVVPPAAAVARVNGKVMGVPHWVCTNYLIAPKGGPLAEVSKVEDIDAAIPSPVRLNEGLLVDMKGSSTLGELYLDALLDRDESLELAEKQLSVGTFDAEVGDVLRNLRQQCEKTLCRDDDYHDAQGFYARQFAHRRGAGLVGYSEALHSIGQENLTACRKEECVSLDQIVVRPLPLSGRGSHAFAWVDLFTVSSSCKGRCFDDAKTFIAETASPEAVRALLIPAWGQAPRYLLPAIASLYSNQDPIWKAAPLYPELLAGVEDAVPVHGKGLNGRLRAIGGKLDQEVLGP